jgi:WD40 repeat protein
MSYVWDVASGNKLLTLRGHETGVCSAQFSPDGSRIVTASADKTVRIWDALTGRQCLVLRGHDASVQTADFSKEGRVILSLSKDGTARLWDSVSNEERAQATNSAMDIAVSTAPSSQPAPANMP